MQIIVYTTNLGGYDELHPAPKDKDGVHYLYYTDGEAPDGWEKVPMKQGGRKESRLYKINSHLLPPHDISIYIDACYKIKSPLSELALFIGDRDIALPEHGSDSCVYDHANRVISLNLDSRSVVRRQMKHYEKKHLPKKFGLSENCLIIRRNTSQVRLLNELWWQEYQKGSQRDQLSLPYALWKTKIKVAWLPFSARKNRWLDNWATHLKSRLYNK
jgi:hypothetical protein